MPDTNDNSTPAPAPAVALLQNAFEFLKRPAVSHALLALALKSKYTAALATLIFAALGLQ